MRASMPSMPRARTPSRASRASRGAAPTTPSSRSAMPVRRARHARRWLRRDLRADRCAGHRRHRAARPAARRHGRARRARVELRERADARRPAAAGLSLPGGEATDRRADHAALRGRAPRPPDRRPSWDKGARGGSSQGHSAGNFSAYSLTGSGSGSTRPFAAAAAGAWSVRIRRIQGIKNNRPTKSTTSRRYTST